MHWEYLKRLIRHKWFTLLECYKLNILWLGLIHDWSKFRPSEWHPYVQSFCGPWEYSNRPQWLVDAFDAAWLYHQRRNKHHWQYWILVQDEDENKILEMPAKYAKEMLADWRGAGRAYDNPDTVSWYQAHKDKMQLHPDTRAWIEQKLGLRKS